MAFSIIHETNKAGITAFRCELRKFVASMFHCKLRQDRTDREGIAQTLIFHHPLHGCGSKASEH
jgi:hypothetical protein